MEPYSSRQGLTNDFVMDGLFTQDYTEKDDTVTANIISNCIEIQLTDLMNYIHIK